MQPVIFTIGHSNHDIDTFIDLLRWHQIDSLVDVRSVPHSRFSPHFRRKALEKHLREVGISYRYMGQRLGGRPEDTACYGDAGQVDYRRVAAMDWYQTGIRTLAQIAAGRRVVIMCAEEDPARCHRNNLIANSLIRDSLASVQHIRRDGRLESASIAPRQTRLI